MPLLYAMIGLVIPLSHAQNYHTTVIDSPVTDYRCNQMMNIKKQKITYKYRLASLLHRNEKLLKNASPEHKSAIKKLKSIHKILQQKMELATLDIEKTIEKAIYKGCPDTPYELAD